MIGHVMVRGMKTERPLEHTQDGVWYRKGTADDRTLAEIPRSYGWLDVEGKTVLDIGAHIGGFSMWAIKSRASAVVAVEPDECNFELLDLNTETPTLTPVEIVNAAVVKSRPPDKVTLWYTARGYSHGMNSTQEFQGRYGMEVDTVTFKDLMKFSPEVIKIDCEGAEYQFLEELPDFVKQVAIEIHLTKREWRTRLGPELIARFSGWETVVAPKIGPCNWATIAGWRR